MGEREMNNIYKENYKLKEKSIEMISDFEKINRALFCVGGPLNDNVAKYSKKQLLPFWRIAEISKNWTKEC